jgi:hypothetical protein
MALISLSLMKPLTSMATAKFSCALRRLGKMAKIDQKNSGCFLTLNR